MIPGIPAASEQKLLTVLTQQPQLNAVWLFGLTSVWRAPRSNMSTWCCTTNCPKICKPTCSGWDNACGARPTTNAACHDPDHAH